MKIDKQTAREKEFVALVKRRDKINDAMRNMPKTKLAAPYQRGWLLTLELSEGTLNRSNGYHVWGITERKRESLAKALQVVLQETTTQDVAKIPLIRKSKSLEEVRPMFTTHHTYGPYYTGPGLRSLKPKEYEELDIELKAHFERRTRSGVLWNGTEYHEITYHLNVSDSSLKVKVKKNMITETDTIDPELIREGAWIEAKLEEYYRHSPHWRGEYAYKYNFRRAQRKHATDAVKKIVKGEIDEISDYHKTNRKSY